MQEVCEMMDVAPGIERFEYDTSEDLPEHSRPYTKTKAVLEKLDVTMVKGLRARRKRQQLCGFSKKG